MRVELTDSATEFHVATVDFEVADLTEGKRLIRALNSVFWLRPYAEFDYDGGKRHGCLLRGAVLRAGMLTVDEAKTES